MLGEGMPSLSYSIIPPLVQRSLKAASTLDDGPNALARQVWLLFSSTPNGISYKKIIPITVFELMGFMLFSASFLLRNGWLDVFELILRAAWWSWFLRLGISRH